MNPKIDNSRGVIKHQLSIFGYFVLKHTIVTLLVIFGINIICILWYIDYKQSALVESIVINDAELYSSALTQFRTLYTSEVIVRAEKKGIEVTHDYLSKEGAMSESATLSMLLGKEIGKLRSGAQSRLYSPFPFPWRKEDGGLRDEFSKEAWDSLSTFPKIPFFRFEHFQGRRSIRFATADLMRSACVNCHNSHISSPKNDWEVGDVRGVLEVILPLDGAIAQARASMKEIMLFLLFLSAVGIGILAILFQRLKQIASEAQQSAAKMVSVNKELEKEVSVRKQAELVQLKYQQRLQLHVEHAPLGVIEWNLDFEVIAWNPRAEKIFGYTEAEAIGRHAIELIVPDSARDLVNEIWKDLCANKGGQRSTNQNQTKDGRIIWCEWYNTSLADANGKVIGVASVIQDITETKRLQELESRAGRLETAGIIAGQVAHDFNNLLAPMMAYPELIREELPSDHPALAYLRQIEEAARKIADINQDLLAMGRRGHYNREVLNLNKVIKDALAELKPFPETFSCKLNLCDELMDVFGGNAQLHRMISNLLHNARDAMQEIGQITVTTENYYVDDVSVVYGRVPKGEYVKLTISDTGCGIPDDIVQKIFDPFFTSKIADKKRGSGLGMSVVDSVVKDHNGFIDLSTKIGEGTSFYIYLPITRRSAESKKLQENIGGNEKILVVDDDEIQREVSTRILKSLGYEVSVAESGEKAINFLRNNPQDILMLDMVMPGGIDGAETYRKSLQFSPYQKAIILSGFSGSDRVLEAQKLGAGIFVRKPVTKSVIAAAVRNELAKNKNVNA